MGLGSEIRENVEKVKDVTKQSVRNAGYYVVDTIDDIKFEKKLEREREAQKQEEERQKKQERAKECKKILEEAGIEDVGTMYEQKKRELDSLEEQLRQEEKVLAQTHQEFKDYRAKSKILGTTFAVGVVVFVIAFFSSLWLLIPAAILVILAFVYFCTVLEKAEKRAERIAPPEFLQLKERASILKEEVKRLNNLRMIEKEYNSLMEELSKKND